MGGCAGLGCDGRVARAGERGRSWRTKGEIPKTEVDDRAYMLLDIPSERTNISKDVLYIPHKIRET